jgi:hypothetical protein
MAFSPSDLYSEVLKIIAEHSVDGAVIGRAWLVALVLKTHPIKRHQKKDPDDFSICCRHLAVAASVDKALARLKHQDEGGADPDTIEFDLPRLPGFKHLRKIYPLRRDGLIYLVPIEQMTDEELTAKADTYDKASEGYAEHAQELRRYRLRRGRRAA